MSHRTRISTGPGRGWCGFRLLACGLALSSLFACRNTQEAASPEQSAFATEEGATPTLEAPAEAAEELQEAAETAVGQEVPAEAKADPADKKPADPADLALEVEKKVREIDIAALELQIAERKARSEEAAAADAVEAATRDHAAALRALEHYSTIEKVILLAQAQLKIDRAAFSLQDAEQKLEQMVREYGKYETDELTVETGKIVINRSQKMVEFQKRSLDLEVGKHKTLAEFTVPEQIAKLEGEASKKKSALARADEARERKSFEAELAVTKAKNKLTMARLEKARAEKRLAKAN